MRIDRKLLKENARHLMSTAYPPVWQVTLIFLLATVWLSWAAGIVFPNPMDQLEQQVLEAYESGDLYAVQSAASAALQTVSSLGGRIGMFLGFLLSLYGMVMNYGYYSYSLRVLREGQGETGEIFSRFYLSGKIILAEFLCALFICLWSMLFVFPGIIAAYRYRMTPYLLLDDPDLPVLEAIRQSKALMRGRKWELFVLDLSFLPWRIGFSALIAVVEAPALALLGTAAATFASLAAATACNLFFVPYQTLTQVGWYEAVRAGGGQTGQWNQSW